MSGNLTPVYDSLFKTCQSTRRKIFKDKNGQFKEKLEIKNCEKRTIFGSLPFKTNSNWKLDELSDIDCDDQKISERRNRQNNSNDEDHHSGASSSYQKDVKTHQKLYANSSEAFSIDIKGTLANIIAKQKRERQNKRVRQNGQGVKTLYEKVRGDISYGYTDNSSTTDGNTPY